jgi:HSP20 family protein
VLGWDPFADNFRIVERFGGRFQGGWTEDQQAAEVAGALQPKADLFEDESGLIIEIEMPGVSPIDVSVNISGEFIVVEAERRFSRNGRQIRQLESSYGRLRREFALPVRSRAEGVTAELRYGFLRITVPRLPATVFHERTIVPKETDHLQPIDVN